MGYEARKPYRGARRSAIAGLAVVAGSQLLASTALAAPAGAEGGFTLVGAAFWALAAITVGSAAGVALSRNIVYSAFSLLGTFLGVAGLYVFLSADFLAVAQLLVYVGGVLVLFLFAVMLTNRIDNVKVSNVSMGLIPATLATVATTALLAFVSVRAPWKTTPGAAGELKPTAEALGELFLNQYLLPFEIASVVLLVTLIGAVVVARKEIKPE